LFVLFPIYIKEVKTKMNEWEISILRCIEAMNGEAILQEIYSKISEFIELTSEHLRPTIYGERPAYQHQVRSHISNLCQAGELRWISRGKYALTSAGRKRIA
jgi:restriction endonuclease Mrr